MGTSVKSAFRRKCLVFPSKRVLKRARIQTGMGRSGSDAFANCLEKEGEHSGV